MFNIISEVVFFLGALLGIVLGILTLISYYTRSKDKKFELVQRLSLQRWKAKAVAFVTILVFLSVLAASALGLNTETYLSIAGSLFFLLTVIYLYVIYRLSRSLYHCERKAERFQKAVEKLTPFMKEFTNTNLRSLNNDDDGTTSPNRSSDLKSLLTRIAHIFTGYTSDDCSVSIKQFAPEPNEGTSPGKVFSLQRDAISLPNREHTDNKSELQEYDWTENSAFSYIVNTNNDARAYYMQNDLAALGDQYENKNPDWKHFYNAVLVVPVSTSDNPGTSDEFYGFLCIDNFKGGFDRECVDLAFMLSKLILHILHKDDRMEVE